MNELVSKTRCGVWSRALDTRIWPTGLTCWPWPSMKHLYGTSLYRWHGIMLPDPPHDLLVGLLFYKETKLSSPASHSYLEYGGWDTNSVLRSKILCKFSSLYHMAGSLLTVGPWTNESLPLPQPQFLHLYSESRNACLSGLVGTQHDSGYTFVYRAHGQRQKQSLASPSRYARPRMLGSLGLLRPIYFQFKPSPSPNTTLLSFPLCLSIITFLLLLLLALPRIESRAPHKLDWCSTIKL